MTQERANDFREASITAVELLKQWGLWEKGWRFQFNKRKTAFGLCSKRKKTIYLSSVLFPTINEEQRIDTIKHEIAHALDFEERGISDHGYKWKAWAIKVGADPSFCKRHTNEEEYQNLKKQSKYTLVCPNGHEFHRHRKAKSLDDCSCPKCSNTYNPKYRLRLIQNY